MTKGRVAVIGAGMAGMACAQALAAQGLQVVVFEKSRG
ncbi:FAD-dependent oxidoreductase, partial [Chitinimonas sp.]